MSAPILQVPGNMQPGFPGGMSAMPMSDGRAPSGQSMPQSPPYGFRQNSSQVLFQADGSYYRSSGRFPQKGDDRTYVDIHNLNPYAQVLYTYEGSHGYRDNSYLIFFPREEWYQERQKYSLRSVTAFKSVVDAMVLPVFEKEVMRKCDDAMYNALLLNADNTGTGFQDINETLLTHARMFGVTFLIMDNFRDADKVSTIQQAVDDRIMPYMYEKMPHEVYKWKCDNWGKLIWISFFEKQEMIPDPEHEGKFIIRQYYRRWNDTFWEVYYEKRNPAKYDEVIEISVEKNAHGLSYLPILAIIDFAKSNNLTNFPTPILADLANMAFVLYNLESWIMLLDVFCFPILTIPPIEGSQLALSATNAIEVPNDAQHAPQFISPPTQCLEVLLKGADRLEDKIYKAANQLGVSGTRAHAMTSGVSKEWDFRGSNSLLQKTATVAKKVEDWVVKTFNDYTHTKTVITVEYPSEFVEAYSNQRLDQAVKLLQEMPPAPFANALWQEIAKVYFDDDPDKAQELCDALEKAFAQSIKDKTAMDEQMSKGGQEVDPDGKPITPAEKAPDTGKGGEEEDQFKSLIANVLTKFKKAPAKANA
jgi:hypothetical protein